LLKREWLVIVGFFVQADEDRRLFCAALSLFQSNE
jgi:hypothetical protein